MTNGSKVRRRAVWIVAIVIAFALMAFVVQRGLIALQKAKQGRSMADLYTIATAVSAYALDHHEYPAASTLKELSAKVEPTYVKRVPDHDMWGHAYRYECWKTRVESAGCDAYAVVSAGADGRFQQASGRQYRRAATTNPDDDIVYVGMTLPTRDDDKAGEFIQYPAVKAIHD